MHIKRPAKNQQHWKCSRKKNGTGGMRMIFVHYPKLTSAVLSPKKWIVGKSDKNCKQYRLSHPLGKTSMLICPPSTAEAKKQGFTSLYMWSNEVDSVGYWCAKRRTIRNTYAPKTAALLKATTIRRFGYQGWHQLRYSLINHIHLYRICCVWCIPKTVFNDTMNVKALTGCIGESANIWSSFTVL